MRELINIIFTAQFLHSVFRVTTLFYSLPWGSDRKPAGVANIALEGIMLISAFFGVFGSAATGSALGDS